MSLILEEIEYAAEYYLEGFVMPEDLTARSFTPMDLFWLTHDDTNNKPFDKLNIRDRAGVVAAFLESDKCNVFVSGADLLPDGMAASITSGVKESLIRRVKALVVMPDGPEFEEELRLVLGTCWRWKGDRHNSRNHSEQLVFKGGIESDIPGSCLGYAAWNWWTFCRGRCTVTMRRAAARAVATPDDVLRGEIAQIKRAAGVYH
jgi:hypothetical protein